MPSNLILTDISLCTLIDASFYMTSRLGTGISATRDPRSPQYQTTRRQIDPRFSLVRSLGGDSQSFSRVMLFSSRANRRPLSDVARLGIPGLIHDNELPMGPRISKLPVKYRSCSSTSDGVCIHVLLAPVHILAQ